MNAIEHTSPPTEATLSAYYKSADGTPRQLQAVIGVDPEGVTEEDVSRLRMDVIEYYVNTEPVHQFPLNIFVSIQGGKA